MDADRHRGERKTGRHGQKQSNMLQMDGPRERQLYLDEKQNPISFPMCSRGGVRKDLRM